MINKYKTLFSDDRLPTVVKEAEIPYETTILTSPDAVAKMLVNAFQHHRETEEVVYEICFDSKRNVVGIMQVSHGTIDSANASPREIFKKALTLGAASIIVAHNHPSGNPKPSTIDINLIDRLHDAGNVLEVPMDDFIIIGKDSYYSFAESGVSRY